MRSVAFLLTPGFTLIDLSAAMAFQVANEVVGDSVYSVAFVSERGGPVKSAMGLVVETAPPARTWHDTVFCIGTSVPQWPSADMISFLQRAHALSRRLAASSTAAFQLAAAGLLEGRRATTHWEHIPEFRRRFPGVQVVADRIFMEDGNVWTSAGMSAVLDLALALIEDDLGLPVSADVAKQLVLYHRRPGGQSQISTLIGLSPRTDRIRRVLSYARANLRRDLTVEELAEVAHLSPRQFSRLFRQETGRSPAKAVEALRIEAARAMLEERCGSLEAVAVETGFADRGRMRRAFIRAFGEPPACFMGVGPDRPALTGAAA